MEKDNLTNQPAASAKPEREILPFNSEECAEYFSKVTEAINRRTISIGEAEIACTDTCANVAKKLGRLLPFNHMYKCNIWDVTGKLFEPNVGTRYASSLVLARLDPEKLKEYKTAFPKGVDRDVTFESVVGKLKLFPDYVYQVFDNNSEPRIFAPSKKKEFNDAPLKFMKDVPFQMLDFKTFGDGTPMTALEKESLVREPVSRFATWHDLHLGLERVAVDTMQEKGLVF